MPSEDLYKVAVNSLSAHVAILDKNGLILETNKAWQDFALENGMPPPGDCVGQNYLAICDSASDDPTDESHLAAQGIRKVMSDTIKEFYITYPCHSPEEERWFALRAVKYKSSGKPKVIVTHENITPLMKAQKELVRKGKELSKQKQKLEEANVALKVLLDHKQQDRLDLEESLLVNVRESILPYIEQLQHGKLSPRERTLAEIIDSRLNEIISPFLNKLSTVSKLLTPQEIKVATFVREGRTSKEIADILGISASAVDFHRKKLREKLGLSNTKSNLRSYLLSLR